MKTFSRILAALIMVFSCHVASATTYEEALSQSIAAFGWCFVAEAEKQSLSTPGDTCVANHLANVSLILTMPMSDPDRADLWSRCIAIEVQLYATGQTSVTAEADYNSACTWYQTPWQTYAQSYSNNTTAIAKAQSACCGWRGVHNALIGGEAAYGAIAIAEENSLNARINLLKTDIETGINN